MRDALASFDEDLAELALRNFVTLDRRQQQLARAAELRVVPPKP
jgi:hypothetical protein